MKPCYFCRTAYAYIPERCITFPDKESLRSWSSSHVPSETGCDRSQNLSYHRHGISAQHRPKRFCRQLGPFSDLLCAGNAVSTCGKHAFSFHCRPAGSRVAVTKRTKNEPLVVMNHFPSRGSCSSPLRFARYHHHTIPFGRTGLARASHLNDDF